MGKALRYNKELVAVGFNSNQANATIRVIVVLVGAVIVAQKIL